MYVIENGRVICFILRSLHFSTTHIMVLKRNGRKIKHILCHFQLRTFYLYITL